MSRKFGRNLQNKESYDYDFNYDFAVESYLEHQGKRFVERFDADSYFYITRATDYFDLSAHADGDLVKTFALTKAAFLVVSFSSDWLFPAYQSRELVHSLLKNGNDVTYCNIESSYGHDAFLLETDALGNLMLNFLKNLYSDVTEP